MIEYGFRLPSALDNRPLKFEEFEQKVNQIVYVSATPGNYELDRGAAITEQIIRPTGLLDPKVEVRPIQGQIDDLLAEIRLRIEKNQRVLVTTLTKRMAEDLTKYLKESGIKVNYLHYDVKTLERTEIIRNLRLGEYDVLVGINLLREGVGYPRSFFGGHSRRRQGRVSPGGAFAHPDHRPCCPERRRTGDHVC